MSSQPAAPPPTPLFALPTPVPQMGLPTDKGTLDRQFGSMALAVRNALNNVIRSKPTLDALTAQDLTDRGYTDEQVAQLRSAWNDLYQLAQVFYGQTAGGDVHDYTTFARFLWGLGVTV